jgi:hypothetical protein
MHSKLFATIVVFMCFSGCAHTQLKFNTSRQAKTVADVHTQQVLDNLAKFARDPYALPHFSYPNSGAANVTSSLSGSTGFSFSPYRLLGWNTAGNGSRSAAESYTMTPINDPRKLELMRCAYQQAVSGCRCGGMSAHCPDCIKRFNARYLGSTTISKTPQQTSSGQSISTVIGDIALVYFPDPNNPEIFVSLRHGPTYRVHEDRDHRNQRIYRLLDDATDASGLTVPAGTAVYKQVDLSKQSDVWSNKIEDPVVLNEAFKQAPFELKQDRPKTLDTTVLQPFALQSEDLAADYVDNTLAEAAERSGSINPSCLNSNCWFRVGKKHEVPFKTCNYVGSNCGTYIWVPCEGRDALTKLTLTILDLATNDPPAATTDEVIAFVGEDGRSPATKETASFAIKAKVRRGSAVTGIFPGTVATALTPSEQRAKKNLTQERLRLLNGFKKLASEHVFELNANPRLNELRPKDAKKFIPFQATEAEIIELAKLLDLIPSAELPAELQALKAVGFDLVAVDGDLKSLDKTSQARAESPPANDFSAPSAKPDILRLQQSLEFLGL